MAQKVIRPLRTEAEYGAAIDEIERYFDKEPKKGSVEADRFDLLALVIEDYERKRWPIDPPDPIDAIRFGMETGGHTQSDLGRLLGSRQRASDILSRKRPLTMGMAWRLNREWESRPRRCSSRRSPLVHADSLHRIRGKYLTNSSQLHRTSLADAQHARAHRPPSWGEHEARPCTVASAR
jgi:HTH-type transcriptional regulator/antitoxin HigA